MINNKKVKKKCKHCSNLLKNQRSQFCNAKCFGLFLRDRTKEMVLKGLVHQRRTLLFHLIEERGHICEVCQNTCWNEQNIPLELHHIDGNHENDFPQNLQILCPNCHAQTDTYKNKNKGHGRKRPISNKQT